jgi:hypothetical protein
VFTNAANASTAVWDLLDSIFLPVLAPPPPSQLANSPNPVALRLSDHKPVECGLRATVRLVKDDARNFVYRNVLSKLEVGTNSTARGAFTISPQFVDFVISTRAEKGRDP